jgi:hypothetical protein
MQLQIGGRLVAPRNWSKFLHLRQRYEYRPHQQGASAVVDFGYSCSLEQVVQVLQERKSGKNAPGSEASMFQKFKGVFYYHKNRLTLQLVPTAFQKRFDTSDAMKTTQMKIGYGVALIGVCNENYLTQAHNKTAYIADSSSSLRFDGLAQSVSARMDRHVSTVVAPALAQVLGKVPVFTNLHKEAAQSEDDESRDDAPNVDELTQHHARRQKRVRQPAHTVGSVEADSEDDGGSDDSGSDDGARMPPITTHDSAAPPTLRKRKRKQQKRKTRPARMPAGCDHTPAPVHALRGLASLKPNVRVRATDGTVGRVEVRPGDRCKLRLADHRLTHRTYRCQDLEATVFNPYTVCLQPAPRAPLLGAVVELVNAVLIRDPPVDPQGWRPQPLALRRELTCAVGLLAVVGAR